MLENVVQQRQTLASDGLAIRRVVICGAGIIGSATAYYLSQYGIQPVLVERGGVACASSGARQEDSSRRGTEPALKADQPRHCCAHAVVQKQAMSESAKHADAHSIFNLHSDCPQQSLTLALC